ncbi:retron St85 family RNA-directed DNA polymerase [Ralstonia nicotianae]|uniref:RNA-directed DNA polymerase n=1 Tax=Ralstonia nicotianae TaxID=3037696 RepID=A0ABX7ZYH7_9RALS|nr:retron St85 family RNA-directed DNA polymerase [Ralstonia nicotianae]QUP59764.1 RNA-directed DNA polymerase [Ralstonia nicotianae]
MPSLITLAATECFVPEIWVRDVIRLGPSRVKRLRIRKKSSASYRVIKRPSAELEILQRWLTLKFFENLEMHDAAMAFRRGRSILTNAQHHVDSKYFLRIDFTNFFPSIKYDDLKKSVDKSSKNKGTFDAYHDADLFIKRVCFDENERLPIGYISSPAISNAVMLEFDEKVHRLIESNEEKLGAGKFTRYADDVVFSTDKKGGCTEFLKIFSSLVDGTTSPKLSINEKKTIFSSKLGGSAIVTGLRVCRDSHITVNREYKDQIRLMLSLYEKGKLDKEEHKNLKGHLSYVRSVAPAFFSRLCAKYFKSIEEFM